jgi:hypothetical protein
MTNLRTYIAFLFLLLLVGCKPEIGDSCGYDVDCSANGDRICDNNQPGGYCLKITCSAGSCPKEASCVEFITQSPAFDSDDTGSADPFDTDEQSALYTLLEQNRTRTYCLQRCKKDNDCRARYHCADADELDGDLGAVVLDEKHQDRGICVPGARDDYSDSDTQ